MPENPITLTDAEADVAAAALNIWVEESYTLQFSDAFHSLADKLGVEVPKTADVLVNETFARWGVKG